MGIVKKINGTEQEIANKSVIDHSQLSNRDAYGAHPISAIRKLPEKLSKLQSNIEEEAGIRKGEVTRLDGKIDEETSARISKDNEIERKARQIKLVEDQVNKGKLLFTNYDNQTTPLQGGFLPDEDTLTLTGNNEMTIKQLYVDGTTIIGTGSRPFNAHIENKKINSSTITSFELDTLKFIENCHKLNYHIKNGAEVQLQYINIEETGELETTTTNDTLHITKLPGVTLVDGTLDVESSGYWKVVNIDAISSQDDLGLTFEGTPAIGDILSFTLYTSENELKAIAIEDTISKVTPSDVRELQADSETHTEEISDLTKRVDAIEGVGGYLNPYDFDNTTPNLPLDNIVLDTEGNYDAAASTLSELTQYALSQITSIDNPIKIWNGTRVTNLENNHTWILNNNYPQDFSWTDLGQALVSTATTETLGVVRASTDNLKVNVDMNGEMTVNNLEDTLNDIIENQNYIIVNDKTDLSTIVPREGLKVYVKSEGLTYTYKNGSFIAGNIYTNEDVEKVGKLTIDSTGEKYLSDNGTYSNITKLYSTDEHIAGEEVIQALSIESIPLNNYNLSTNLVNCSLNNNPTTLLELSSFKTTLTPIPDYYIQEKTVKVEMDNLDVTSYTFNKRTNIINIEEVLGNVHIYATAMDTLPKPDDLINTKWVMKEQLITPDTTINYNGVGYVSTEDASILNNARFLQLNINSTYFRIYGDYEIFQDFRYVFSSNTWQYRSTSGTVQTGIVPIITFTSSYTDTILIDYLYENATRIE